MAPATCTSSIPGVHGMEKKNAAVRGEEGIPMSAQEAEAFKGLSAEYGVEFI